MHYYCDFSDKFLWCRYCINKAVVSDFTSFIFHDRKHPGFKTHNIPQSFSANILQHKESNKCPLIPFQHVSALPAELPVTNGHSYSLYSLLADIYPYSSTFFSKIQLIFVYSQ